MSFIKNLGLKWKLALIAAVALLGLVVVAAIGLQAVGSMESISRVIAQISDIATSIAGAVEQQSATTSEMARNVAEAAKGSVDIARNISTVTEAAQSTSSGASRTISAAGDLARMTAELEQLVASFSFEDAALVRSLVARPEPSGAKSGKTRRAHVLNVA